MTDTFDTPSSLETLHHKLNLNVTQLETSKKVDKLQRQITKDKRLSSSLPGKYSFSGLTISPNSLLLHLLHAVLLLVSWLVLV